MAVACKQAQSIQDKIIKELEAAPPPERVFWTDFEISLLKKYYGKKDFRAIAKALNRTPGAVQRYASYLGLTYKR